MSMSDSLSHFLENLSEFEFKQTMGVDDGSRAVEKFLKHTSYETINEYQILTKNQKPWGVTQECDVNNITLYALKKYFLRSKRATRFLIRDSHGRVRFYVKRPFHFLTSTNIAEDRNHNVLCYVFRRFSLFNRRYELRTANKRLLGFIDAPITKPWTFPVFDLRRRRIGLIRKKIPGVGELMTYRETLHIRCSSTLSTEGKMMMMVTALTLCMDLFE